MLRHKRTLSDHIFDISNTVFLILLALSTLYPFWYLIVKSIIPEEASQVISYIIPPKVTFRNYLMVLSHGYVVSGFTYSVYRTMLGTFLQLIFCITTAYPLSKKYFPNRTFWTSFIVFTMFFSGGLIPSYILIRNLGMIDKIWALVLPPLIPTFSMLIMRNFFMQLPQSLEESAKIDGANILTILLKIVIPISKPIIATIVLWGAVGHWNSWFDALIYMTSSNKTVVQIVLRKVVIQGTNELWEMMNQDPGRQAAYAVNPENLKAATVIVGTLPILLAYPFLQKYFVKGIMIGSLKG